MPNIILIGMPASGKSTVGVILAKLLAYDFIDTDLVIQKREGSRLKDIIENRGVDGFLAAEEAACMSIQAQHCVIATGGSVVYSEAAMKHLKALGRVVYLKAEYSALFGRLQDIRGRGVVLRSGQTLEDLYNERTPLYEKYADIIISEDSGGLEDKVAKVFEACTKE